MPIKAVAFDLDGTLVNSLADITTSLNVALASADLPAKTPEWVRDNVGQGATHLVTQALNAASAVETIKEQVLTAFVQHYEKYPCTITRPYPGVDEVLAWCGQQGFPLVVISNKPEVIAKKVLKILELAPCFQEILGGDSLEEKKPSPAPLIHFMTRWGLSPREVIMVGDSSIDVRFAQRAKVWSCLYSGGYGALGGKAEGPEAIIDSWDQFPGVVDRFNAALGPEEVRP